MDKKVIWLINQNSVPLKYGNFNRHFDIAEELVKRGHEVNIIASNYRPRIHKRPPNNEICNYEEVNGIKVWWLRGLTYETNQLPKRALQWLLFSYRLFSLPFDKISKPDVVIASSLPPTVFINGYHLKKKFNAKLIVDVRDVWPKFLTDMNHFSKYNPFILFLRAIEKFGYKKADHIVSAWPRFDIHVKESIDKDFKFTCVPKGVKPQLLETENKKELPEELVNEYLPKDKFIVGYCGLVSSTNKLSNLIECAKILKDENIHFAIMGNGPHKEKLIKMAVGLDNISFVPAQPKHYVQSFLSKCDLLYSGLNDLDLYRYGTALNKWVEYMLAAKPVVCAYNGYQTLINEADCGVFVNSDDFQTLSKEILNYSKKSNEELEEIGERGQKWIINNRTFDKVAEIYESTFN